MFITKFGLTRCPLLIHLNLFYQLILTIKIQISRNEACIIVHNINVNQFENQFPQQKWLAQAIGLLFGFTCGAKPTPYDEFFFVYICINHFTICSLYGCVLLRNFLDFSIGSKSFCQIYVNVLLYQPNLQSMEMCATYHIFPIFQQLTFRGSILESEN